MTTNLTSTQARDRITEAMELDLIGPWKGHAFQEELLPEPPSRWYLTGFLVPLDAAEEEKYDEQSTDEATGAGEEDGAGDDAGPPDPAATKSFLPSSMGMSLLLPSGVESLRVTVEWGDYEFEGKEESHGDAAGKTPGEGAATGNAGEAKTEPPLRGYRRTQHAQTIAIPIPPLLSAGRGIKDFPVPDSNGLRVAATARPVSALSGLAQGTVSLSLFVVNGRPPDPERRYASWVFQTRLIAESEKPFVARPDPRGLGDGAGIDEWDLRVGNLHYRDVCEYGVGHGVATLARHECGDCHKVQTTWIPRAEVRRVAPNEGIGAEMGMEELGQLKDGADAKAKLAGLVSEYDKWIEVQKGKRAGLSPANQKTLDDLIANAAAASKRIAVGIDHLADPQILEAFKIANRAMAAAGRRRQLIANQHDESKVKPPRWRPFQLAFILLALRGITDPKHPDREIVDLLFFPTGGGKTEAYLGLAAFTMVLRRFRNEGIRSAGVTVLMRYTLRLLTLDQLGRAAALMCALEKERAINPALGKWPFEIGLWVGSAATPNLMGFRGYDGPGRETTARAKTLAFFSDDRKPSPIPIEECPWCGRKFTRDSFRLVPNQNEPTNLHVKCVNHKCEFSGDAHLPILGVDEPIYRRLPAFLIATVDKFAALPWTGRVGALFGLVDRYDPEGFYGPMGDGKGASRGQPLGEVLPPPELIIQDELHLISGPLGTIAGLYETVIDDLSSRGEGDAKIRPKIVASTATVRRAESQIQALFDRHRTAVFPPPGPDITDSFFALTEPTSKTPARLYLGVAAQGRSLKVIMLRTALAVMSAAGAIYKESGGKKNLLNPADPYMTLLAYFTSMRELGGSRRIFEDEVSARLERYSRRRRLDPPDTFFEDRRLASEIRELTSRVSTNDVAAAKRCLSQPFHEKDSVDVALATNMISVGLDIIRLGLMLVNGQPKTASEYIQSTSRVGRDPARPGLVITMFNIHRPRDRSHYERFTNFHDCFYRSVEATSVTPFSPRAMDRALPAALVGLCRQGFRGMTPALGAMEIENRRGELTAAARRFAERSKEHRDLSAADREAIYDYVLARCNELLDAWLKIEQECAKGGVKLVYNPSEGGGQQRLLYDPLNPELATIEPIRRNFRANRSMRDVEATVELAPTELHRWGT